MNKSLEEEIRLNAKGAEREARLIAQLEMASKEIAKLKYGYSIIPSYRLELLAAWIDLKDPRLTKEIQDDIRRLAKFIRDVVEK